MAQGRIFHDNLVQRAASVLTASSEDPSFPAAALLDQLRSETWRSLPGYNVISNLSPITHRNHRVPFTEGTSGSKVAGVATGNYATPALYAAAVQAAMNASAVDNTYSVTYDAGTKKFTIARATGTDTFSLDWASDPGPEATVGKDMGFDVSADDTGATSYEADSVSYHSREWLKVDLGSAMAVRAGIVIDHNAGAGGTFTLRGNATDAWGSPSFSQALAGDADIRIDVFSADQTFRWWELLIEDVSNPDGFSEVGVWFAGPGVFPTHSYTHDLAESPVELSSVEVAEGGAHYQDEKPTRRVWSLAWADELLADRDVLTAWRDAMPVGRAHFFNFTDAETDTHYVYRAGPMGLELTSDLYWTISQAIAEALG